LVVNKGRANGEIKFGFSREPWAKCRVIEATAIGHSDDHPGWISLLSGFKTPSGKKLVDVGLCEELARDIQAIRTLVEKPPAEIRAIAGIALRSSLF